MKITLGDPLGVPPGGRYDQWPVLRDGQNTGCKVVEGRRGYAFWIPSSLMRGESSNQWPYRPFREDARRDAEEWFKEREKGA
ncbi:hypothetical protein ACFW2V_13450 [Streptomyces sp. NPDC058947]|uniref:hypothetical protein n=1 Tax=Streptomyces sp. NPDC058947 TaxID=3346675 RepID=UPI0036C1D31F